MSHQIGSLALASHATDLKAEILSRTKPIVIHQIFTKWLFLCEQEMWVQAIYLHMYTQILHTYMYIKTLLHMNKIYYMTKVININI